MDKVIIVKDGGLFRLLEPSLNELRSSIDREFGVEVNGKCYLSPIEVIYLVYLGYKVYIKGSTKPISFNEVMSIVDDRELWVKFVVYYDLKKRGRRVRVRSERGFTFIDPQTKEDVEVVVMEESRKLKVEEIVELIEKYSKMGKQLLLAIADRHGDVTYYHVSRIYPTRSGKEVSSELL